VSPVQRSEAPLRFRVRALHAGIVVRDATDHDELAALVRVRRSPLSRAVRGRDGVSVVRFDVQTGARARGLGSMVRRPRPAEVALARPTPAASSTPRKVTADGKRAKLVSKDSFPWDIGIRLRAEEPSRAREDVRARRRQANRRRSGTWLVGRPPGVEEAEMRFSLVVSVIGPGVYAAIKPPVEAAASIPVEI
jgi:hypothetical protein